MSIVFGNYFPRINSDFWEPAKVAKYRENGLCGFWNTAWRRGGVDIGMAISVSACWDLKRIFWNRLGFQSTWCFIGGGGPVLRLFRTAIAYVCRQLAGGALAGGIDALVGAHSLVDIGTGAGCCLKSICENSLTLCFRVITVRVQFQTIQTGGGHNGNRTGCAR